MANIDERTKKAEEENIDPRKSAVNLIAQYCYTQAHAMGWWKEFEEMPDDMKKYWIASKLLLINSEVCEGMEGLRKDLMDDHLPNRKMLEVELADAAIRIMDLAAGLGMDLGGAIAEKLDYNLNRPDHQPEARAAAGGKSI